MHLSKHKQLQHECKTLRQMLLFLKEENVLLKNRLSEILKTSFDKSSLEEAEGFNNAFIREDERIYLLRNDLAWVDNLLEKPIATNADKVPNELDSKIEQLRKNVANAENQFIKMQAEFYKYFYEKM